jgi:hypothetical protein
MRLTIAFITARLDPMLSALIASLAPQMRAGDEVSLLVVDALGRSLGDLGLIQAVRFRTARSMLPKPNIWQGPHRIAPQNYFANANARNTAFVYCDDDYIAFLDDRTTLDPTWLDAVRQGERERASVLCGPVDKHLSGQDAVTWGPISYDSRTKHAPNGLINCGGSWCFGANFALPLEWALAVNGCEEGCDPVGCEDYIFGSMLSNAGRRIDFTLKMGVQQDRKGSVHVEEFPRVGKGAPGPADKSQALTRRYRTLHHTMDTPDLRALRGLVQRNEALPRPDPNMDYRDWFDGALVREYKA